MDPNVNFLAVLVATIAGFATGAIWYTVLSRHWIKAVGLMPEEMNRGSPLPFIIGLIANALMASILALIVIRFGDVTVFGGIRVAALVWLGFVASTIATNYAFAMKPWRLLAIDGGHWLAVLLVQGIIIGLFGL